MQSTNEMATSEPKPPTYICCVDWVDEDVTKLTKEAFPAVTVRNSDLASAARCFLEIESSERDVGRTRPLWKAGDSLHSGCTSYWHDSFDRSLEFLSLADDGSSLSDEDLHALWRRNGTSAFLQAAFDIMIVEFLRTAVKLNDMWGKWFVTFWSKMFLPVAASFLRRWKSTECEHSSSIPPALR